MLSRPKFAAVIATGLLLATSAFVSAEAQSKPTIVFVTNGASDFWKAAAAGVKAAQKDLPGFKLELQYPDQATVASQNQLLDNLVSAGVKGIIMSAVDPKNDTKELDKIAGETALFTTDSDAPQTKRIAYIGSSNILAGEQAAKIAKEALPHGGKCMGFVGLLGADNARERIQGFKEGLKGTGISLIDVRGDQMDMARAKSNVSDALVANPSINCLVGFYSYNTPEIYAALKESGQLGKITVVGFDGDPVTLGGIQQGVVAGTVVQQPYVWAYKGMHMIASYLKGDKSVIPANGIDIIPTRIIDKSNVAQYAAEQQKMSQ
ncbi:sugar-binding protein [Acidisoma sp. C75]